jgi:hypothetical protein
MVDQQPPAGFDPPIVFDDDKPEWIEADFAHARLAAEVQPAE